MATNCCGTSEGEPAKPACGCGQAQSRPGPDLGLRTSDLGPQASPATGATLVRAPVPVAAPWVDGTVATPIGPVSRVKTVLEARDRIGTIKARSGVGRMNYRVPPSLYAVGNPTPDSPVFVSANYKLSFDRLRAALAGHDGWVLVIDTHGINVWCAAGKGTFGTGEVVNRVLGSGLARVVSHRKLVLPQLSATGVSAREVRKGCGFTVIFGPVRAEDLPAFLAARMKASPEMRRVRFALKDRAVLVPVEVVMGAKIWLPVAAAFVLLGGLGRGGYSIDALLTTGVHGGAALVVAFLAGAVAGPILLPWLPGRAFSLKGAALGLASAAGLLAWQATGGTAAGSAWHAAAWALIVPAISSFLVMTFTGSSTFTSLSGVLREMRVAVPAQIAAGSIGVVLWITGLFVGGGAGQ